MPGYERLSCVVMPSVTLSWLVVRSSCVNMQQVIALLCVKGFRWPDDRSVKPRALYGTLGTVIEPCIVLSKVTRTRSIRYCKGF